MRSKAATGWSGVGADAFRLACERLQNDKRQASDALEHTAGVLSTLSARVEQIEQWRNQAQSVEWEAWSVDDSTEAGQQHYSRLMSRAHSLRRQADDEARSADAQAAAAFEQISAAASLLAESMRRGTAAGSMMDEANAWNRYYQKQQRQYDEEDHTAYSPTASGQSTFWDKAQMVMSGGVDGTKELALEFVQTVAHPLETVKSIVYTVTHPEELIESWIETGVQVRDDWNKGNAYGVSKTLTQVAWTIVGLKKAGLSEEAAEAAGNAMKSGFGSLIGESERVVLSDGTIIRVSSDTMKINEALVQYLQASHGEIQPGDFSPLAPGGGLAAHESTPTQIKGHTLERHVPDENIGLSDALLAERMQSDPRITGASSFTDRAIAEQVIQRLLNSEISQSRIRDWLASSQDNRDVMLKYNGDGTTVIGRGILRGNSEAMDMRKARVILRKDANGGWYILTAYPVR